MAPQRRDEALFTACSDFSDGSCKSQYPVEQNEIGRLRRVQL
jgi:hypothetical protein